MQHVYSNSVSDIHCQQLSKLYSTSLYPTPYFTDPQIYTLEFDVWPQGLSKLTSMKRYILRLHEVKINESWNVTACSESANPQAKNFPIAYFVRFFPKAGLDPTTGDLHGKHTVLFVVLY